MFYFHSLDGSTTTRKFRYLARPPWHVPGQWPQPVARGQGCMCLYIYYYVRCVLIDFSKAFDTVNHSILIEKLKRLKLPTFIHGWILNFLTDRKQSTKFNGELLSSIITRSIVQGSGLTATWEARWIWFERQRA